MLSNYLDIALRTGRLLVALYCVVEAEAMRQNDRDKKVLFAALGLLLMD